MNCGLTNNLHTMMESSIIELDELADSQFTITGTSLINYAKETLQLVLETTCEHSWKRWIEFHEH